MADYIDATLQQANGERSLEDFFVDVLGDIQRRLRALETLPDVMRQLDGRIESAEGVLPTALEINAALSQALTTREVVIGASQSVSQERAGAQAAAANAAEQRAAAELAAAMAAAEAGARLAKSANLSDVAAPATALANLGGVTAAAANAIAQGEAGTRLTKTLNLSDLASVSAARTNLGLGNVTNTSDANKPVSTAQAAAIAAKLSPNGDGSALAVTPTGGAATTLAAVAALATSSVQLSAFDVSKLVTGARIRLKAGTYLLPSAETIIDGVTDLVIECEPGVIIQDNGRQIYGAAGGSQAAVQRRVPWGLRFRNCSRIKLFGATIRAGNSFGGSSGDFFMASNYQQRVPVLWLDSCQDVQASFYLDGDPGVGIQDKTGMEGADTPLGAAILALRGAMFLASNCADIEVECLGTTTRSRREQYTFAGCEGLRWRGRDYGSATAATWGSLAKIINCMDVKVGPLRGKSAADTSLMDLIASDVTVEGVTYRIPAGKMIDVSHEWGSANVPADNITIQRCSTGPNGGLLVTNVTNQSTSAQVLGAPITNLTIRDCRGTVRFPNLTQMRIVGHEFRNVGPSPNSYIASIEGQIDVVDSTFVFDTSPATTFFYVPRLLRLINCRFVFTSAAPNSISFVPRNQPEGVPFPADESTVDRWAELHACKFDVPAGFTLNAQTNMRLFQTPLAGLTLTKGSRTPSVLQYTGAPTAL